MRGKPLKSAERIPTVPMIIREKPMSWYINRLRRGMSFCFPGYSDAEFYSMMGVRAGDTSGLGQVLDPTHGKRLIDVMRRRQKDPKWFFAIPKCLWSLPVFEAYSIDTFLREQGIQIEGYERDMVLDDLARDAGLFPFITQLQQMDTVIIGPEPLQNALGFLDYKEMIEITSPNLHMTEAGIEFAAERGYKYQDVVFLISAGVSAPCIIDLLYENNPDNTYIDCGSIWDAFAGIGGQRQWRANLYANPDKLNSWRRKNVHGT